MQTNSLEKGYKYKQRINAYCVYSSGRPSPTKSYSNFGRWVWLADCERSVEITSKSVCRFSALLCVNLSRRPVCKCSRMNAPAFFIYFSCRVKFVLSVVCHTQRHTQHDNQTCCSITKKKRFAVKVCLVRNAHTPFSRYAFPVTYLSPRLWA